VGMKGWGQVNIVGGGTYTQDFTSLGTSSLTWANNTTLTGWYISSVSPLLVNTGTTNANACYNFGIAGTNLLTDRALGAISTATPHQFGLRLKNNGASTIASFNISFNGEQWRSFTTGTLVFEYQTGTTVTSLTTGSWTALTTLDFASLVTSTGAATDGNAPANRTAKSATLTVNVLAGNEIFFRWTKAGSSSPGLAIDDLSITATALVCSPLTLSGASQASTVVCGSGPAVINLTGLGASSTNTIAYTINGVAQTPVTGVVADASGNASFTTSILTTANNGQTLQITGITNALGCNTAFTQNVTLAIASLPAAPAAPTVTSTNPSCGATALNSIVPPGGETYYWQGTTALGTSTTSPSTATYPVSTTATYYVRARNNTTLCWSASASSLLVTIVNPPTITTQPTNQSVTTPATATFSVTASNVFTYQWQVNTGSGFTNIGGANSATYTTASTSISMNGYVYKCLITSNSPCTDVFTTNAVNLNVSAGPCVSDASGYPTGAGQWILSGATVSAAQSCSGNGLLFTANGHSVVTPSVLNPAFLTFNKKRSGTAPGGWNMNIEIGTTSSGPWILVSNINTITTACVSTSIDISSYTGTRYIKFTDLRSSGANQIGIDDISITCNVNCTPTTTVTSFLPTSGPAKTLVTITGTGFLTTPLTNGIKFGTYVSPSYTIVSDTKIIAQVPSILSSTSSVSVANAFNCFSTPLPTFTFIKNTGTCTTLMSDLIISEIYDPTSGNNHYIEIYNGTGVPIDLDGVGTDYELQVFTDPSTTNTFDISGTINAGQVLVFYGGANGGLATGTQSNNGSGYNQNDFVRLLKNGSIIDVMNTPNYVGYSWLRLNTVTGPNATYTAAEWSTSASESTINIGFFTALASTLQSGTAVSNVSCSPFTMNTTTISTPVTYQWKYYNSLANTWDNVLAAAIAPATIPSSGVGSATSNTLNLGGDLTHLLDYQFYCQISNAAPCTSPSNAAQYSYNTRKIYRSKVITGNWNTPTNWEMSDDGITWIATCTYPKAVNSDQVIIQNGSYIVHNIDNDIDKITIDNGGTLEISPTIQLKIYNGQAGADLIVNGTLMDRSTTSNGIYLTAFGSTWTLGASATIIKTNTASINEYGIGYEGGIATIPASANWIYRYNADGNLSVSSLGGVGGMFYPNLAFESTSGFHDFTGFSEKFSGSSGFPTIKGNLDIGGTGSGTVTIYNENTNAQAMLINGDLNIRTGSTLNNGAATNGTGFEVKGNINADGTFTVNGNNTGTLTLSGTAAQTVGGSNAIANNMNVQNCIITNTVGITQNKDFNIFGTNTFGANAKLDFGAGIISLKSTLTKTANVAPVPATASITYSGTGRFSIERYLDAIKAWRLLATPVDTITSPTITDSWREGGIDFTSNGYGTNITGADGPFRTYGPAYAGAYLDEYSIRSSMKSYNMATNNFDDVRGIEIQTNKKIANDDGYYIFVRGDRGAATTITIPTSTTLRIKGKIRTGTQTFGVDGNKFRSIGNPFPSRIDMRGVTFGGAQLNSFYLWNPTSPGSYNVGEYQGYSYDLGTGNFTRGATVLNTIESGQAFFVQNNIGTSINLVIAETNKTSGSANVSRQGVTKPTLEINLISKDANGVDYFVDGVKINFDNAFSNLVDNFDVKKINNSFDNLSIKSNTLNLLVERRKMPLDEDSIQLNIAAMRTANFSLEIDPSVLVNAGVTAFLKDRFLQSTTPISLADVTNYNFTTTNDVASKAANRFYIVFKALPSTILTGIAAVRKPNNTIAVKWNVQNETNTNNYELQHSNDGINFSSIATKNALANNNTSLAYTHTDAAATPNNNWYRVKLNPTNGPAFYSAVAMVSKINEKENTVNSEIVITPNQITNNQLTINCINQKLGLCAVSINNAMGQNIFSTTIKITSNNETIKIALPKNIVVGKYNCVVQPMGEEKKVISFVVL
jgi:cytoskeletal protein CcmA (bactofilin family)